MLKKRNQFFINASIAATVIFLNLRSYLLIDVSLVLNESDNVETEPYLQAVREVLDDKFENVITLCTAEINKPGMHPYYLQT